MKKISVKKLTAMAMLAAMAYVTVALVRIPAVLFLKYEPKDVILTIGGFLFGPIASFAVSLAVSLLEMVTISEDGIYGCIMNLVSSCAFACTAALLYRRKHTLGGAIAGLAAGSAAVAGVMVLWNWIITPLYMGIDRKIVEGLLLTTFLPFNLIKAGLNSALTLLLYKPLVTALRRVGLVEKSSGGKKVSMLGVSLLALALLATFFLLLLVLQGKL